MPGDPLQRFRLNGRVAIVTGASSGLGVRFAEVLAAAGASVAVAARRAHRVEEVAERLRAGGTDAVAVRCDVTDDEDVRRLVAATVDRLGSVDVLVNNAGVASREAEDETTGSFRRVVEVNMTGAYRCIRAASPMMLERGRGSIVNIASISGLVAMDGRDLPSYTSSKAGLINLIRNLVVRWANRGVRVNAIAPGYFRSEMTEHRLESEAGLAPIREGTPMGRPGREDELDGALLFLASDASAYVTGQTLAVDCGWTAR